MDSIFKNIAAPIYTSGISSPPEKPKKKVGRKPKSTKISITKELFWNVISEIEWANRDDMIINRFNIKNKLKEKFEPYSDVTTVYNILLSLLKNRFITVGHHFVKIYIIGCDNYNKVNELLSHVIALGKNYYDTIMETPELINFILEENLYQDFHSIITEL